VHDDVRLVDELELGRQSSKGTLARFLREDDHSLVSSLDTPLYGHLAVPRCTIPTDPTVGVARGRTMTVTGCT